MFRIWVRHLDLDFHVFFTHFELTLFDMGGMTPPKMFLITVLKRLVGGS